MTQKHKANAILPPMESAYRITNSCKSKSCSIRYTKCLLVLRAEVMMSPLTKIRRDPRTVEISANPRYLTFPPMPRSKIQLYFMPQAIAQFRDNIHLGRKTRPSSPPRRRTSLAPNNQLPMAIIRNPFLANCISSFLMPKNGVLTISYLGLRTDSPFKYTKRRLLWLMSCLNTLTNLTMPASAGSSICMDSSYAVDLEYTDTRIFVEVKKLRVNW